MTKPTVTTEWASDPTALSVETVAKQKTHGWTTSDDTINGVPPRPNLSNQNWWQNAIYKHIDFVDQNTPDTLGDTVFLDLWEWDTANMHQMDTRVFGAETVIDQIEVIGQNLHWTRFDKGQVLEPVPWLDFQPETIFGALWHEFQDMIGRGLAIQIVDGAGVKWTVYNANGMGIPTNDPILNGISTFIGTRTLKDGTPANRILEWSLRGGQADTDIVKDDGGVITNPDDFSGFVTLNNANFLTNNPYGFRVGLYGQNLIKQNLQFQSGIQVAPGKALRKRWIRPALNTQSTRSNTPNVQWYIPWEAGRRYLVTYNHIHDPGLGGQPSGIVIATDDTRGSGNTLHVCGKDSDTQMIFVRFEMMAPQFPATAFFKGIEFSGLSGMDRLGQSQAGIGSIYGNLANGNIVVIEELD